MLYICLIYEYVHVNIYIFLICLIIEEKKNSLEGTNNWQLEMIDCSKEPEKEPFDDSREVKSCFASSEKSCEERQPKVVGTYSSFIQDISTEEYPWLQ